MRHDRNRTGAGRRGAAAAAAAAAALAVPLLGGCAGGTAPPPASDVAAAKAGDLRAGSTMTWAVDAAPKTLNMHQTDANAATTTVAQAALPILFPLDAKGQPHRDPDYLAKAEAVRPSSDTTGQTVTYTLNPKAVWSDGKPISAADFASQWKALRGTDSAYWADGAGGYNAIRSVTAGAKPHTVKVAFTRPFAEWKQLFSPLYPAAATRTAHAFNDGLRTGLPASGGPFRVQKLSGQQVVLDRNPRWWGHRPALDKLVLKAVPADRRAAALDSGAVDAAPLDLDRPGGAAEYRKLRADSKLTVRRAAGAAWTQLTLNGGSGPLADEKLRRTVARAIDRAAIAKDVNKPYGLPGYAPGSHLLLGTQAGYTDNSSALGPADTDKAAVQKALKAAGSSEAAQRDLKVLIPKDSAQAATVGADVVRMLKKVGIGARTVAVPGSGFFTDHVADGDFDLAVYSWPATAYPSADAQDLYAKPQPSADGELSTGRNYARTGTDEIDLLFRKANAELDPDKAHDLLNTVDARIWREAVSLPLYQRPQAVAMRKGVEGAGAYGLATPDFTRVGFRK